ncbi:helix-turn-helix domain-containing protein [Streptomyces sp. NPDC093149]|uniref:helix-turn-helix domain-containing protein n=1 Tax=Streptomyces sp. NPDC093149 TaxID=3366031 RepID=UPI0037FA7E48
MTARSRPTARQVRLGAELRKLRDAAGMTARELAGLLGTNSAQMSQIEAGNAGVGEERLRRLAAHCACADKELIDALAMMVTDRTRGWWEEFRGVLPPGFLDLSELEHHASFRRDVEIIHVPGLLQTEDYARAVFSYLPPELPEAELEARVAHRMGRRAIFEKDAPVKYQAVIHEAALRIRVGDRGASRAQLDQILALSDREGVTVRVVPFDTDGFAGAGSAMVYAGGPVPRLDTVVRDAPHGTAFLDAESQLDRFRALFRKLEAASLDPGKSRDFIHRMTKEL